MIWRYSPRGLIVNPLTTWTSINPSRSRRRKETSIGLSEAPSFSSCSLDLIDNGRGGCIGEFGRVSVLIGECSSGSDVRGRRGAERGRERGKQGLGTRRYRARGRPRIWKGTWKKEKTEKLIFLQTWPGRLHLGTMFFFRQAPLIHFGDRSKGNKSKWLEGTLFFCGLKEGYIRLLREKVLFSC